jgi:hypothetical protein
LFGFIFLGTNGRTGITRRCVTTCTANRYAAQYKVSIILNVAHVPIAIMILSIALKAFRFVIRTISRYSCFFNNVRANIVLSKNATSFFMLSIFCKTKSENSRYKGKSDKWQQRM